MLQHEHTARRDWLIAAGLLALSFIPVAVGTLRLIQLGTGAAITLENARFFESPIAVVLHLLGSLTFCVLGAFQFVPGFRRRHPAWHRMSGRLLVPCGLIAAFSALWMTQFYPTSIESPASFDGPALYVIRLMAGSAMALSLVLGVAAVSRRDIPQHRTWMMRGYAIGLGAGTQAFTHLPWFLFPDIQGEMARMLCMGAGWAVNLAVAEWLIARERSRTAA